MTDTQCQYLLLRYCTCQNLNHWLRTVRPDLMQTAAESFDEETLTTLQSVLWATTDRDVETINLTEQQIKQARQHCKLGGLGLTSAVATLPAAWLGSWSLTKKLIQGHFKETNFHDILDTLEENPYQNITVQSIKDTHSKLAGEFRRAHKQIVELDKLHEQSKQAQRYFAAPMLKNMQRELLEGGDDASRARLRSTAAPKAGAFLNCIPKIPIFKMGSADFRSCLRLRLGMPQLCVRTDIKCRCGKYPDAEGIHYLTCTHGNHLTTRHELLVKAFHEMVQATSRHSQTKDLEDHLHGFTGPKGNRLVLDQVVAGWTDDREDLALDYAVCHPCAASYLPAAKDDDLGAAGIRGGIKKGKYLGPCRHHDMKFEPAVLEVFGAMDATAQQLIKGSATLLSNQLPEGTASTWTADSFAAFHSQRISISLQRSNAKAIRLRAMRDLRASNHLGASAP